MWRGEAMLNEQEKADLTKRLRKIGGQINSIERMVMTVVTLLIYCSKLWKRDPL